MIAETQRNLLKNFTVFVSIVTGSLFVLGFLYETVYLENFKLNNSEISPDFATSVVYGFRYAFLNGFITVFNISAYGLLSLFFFDSFKKELSSWLEKNKMLSKYLSSTKSFLNKPLPKLYFPLGIVILITLLITQALFMGKKLANEIKNEKSIECISIEGNPKPVEGHIVRIRDNLIVFWHKKTQETYIFPQKKLNYLLYKSCPNKALKSDS